MALCKERKKEFPDWGRVMQGSRMADFTHIDKTALFETESRDHANLHNDSIRS